MSVKGKPQKNRSRTICVCVDDLFRMCFDELIFSIKKKLDLLLIQKYNHS
jgi:hypothetical protein